MDEVGYFEAWSRWAELDDSLKHAYLWGIQVGWWGRLGKILAFISGVLIVLEIVGYKRLQWLISRLPGPNDPFFGFGFISKFFQFILASAPFALFVISITQGWWVPSNVWLFLAGGLIWMLVTFALHVGFEVVQLKLAKRVEKIQVNESATANMVRTISVVLLAVGFHFDMLGS